MELKPCPFCGGEANWRWNDSSKYGIFAYVMCDDCHAQTKIVSVGKKYYEMPKGFDKTDEFWESKPFQTATSLWNQRRRKKKV